MSGDNDTTFRPMDTLKAQEINAAFVKALGFDVAWDDVNAKAEELGIAVDAADPTLVLRGEAFKAIRAALDVTPEGAEVTLGEQMGLTEVGYVAPEVPVVEPEALEATAVAATNVKEVVVTFNKAGEAAKVGAKANYTVNGEAPAAASVSEDGTMVTLTLTTAVAQQGKMAVKVLKAAGVAADTTLEIASVIDTTIPVAESIELTGPKTMDVTFSEPVVATSDAAVVINNGLYGVSSKVLSTDGRTLTITIAASLNDATDYEVKVSGYEDYAGFDALAKTFTVTYVKDTAAPVATLKSASQTEVVIVFDKAVTQKGGAALDADYFYHTYTAWKPVKVTTTDNKTFTLSFKDDDAATTDYYLPVGDSTVKVLAKAADVAVVDAWGNEFAGATFTATVTADTIAPMVTKVEATKENQVKVTFDEAVTTVVGNYTFKDADAEAAATGTITFGYDAKVATFDFANKLAGGTYTVEIKDVKDTSLAANAMATATFEFTVTDKTPATVTATVVETLGDDNAEYVYLTYSENMDTATTLAAANYQLDGAALPTGSKVEAFMGTLNKVKITIPKQTATLVGDTRLVVGQVADVAGNKIAALATAVTITGDTAPTIDTVKSLGLNKVEIKITGLLDAATVTTSGVKILTSDAALTLASIDSVTKTATATTVVAYLQADEVLADANDVVDAIELGTTTWKSETAKAVELAGTVTYTDGIAPTITKIEQGGDTVTYVVTYDEAVTNPAFAANDFVVTLEGKALVAGTDFTYNDGTITILKTVEVDDVVTIATVEAPIYITDADGAATINAKAAVKITVE
jgi:hypothetical protein